MDKYVFVKEYDHYNMWLNKKNNCRECYFKDENPNYIAAHEEQKSKNLVRTRAKENRAGIRWKGY